MSSMNIDELKKTVAAIEEQYKNLSNPEWVTQQLHRLKGQYDILNEVITGLENDLKEKPSATNKPAE